METAAPILAFRAIPTTLLALVTYFSIFIALIVTDALPNIPKNQGGLNIKQAYQDLRQVLVSPIQYPVSTLKSIRLRLILTLITLT